jgi:death-on-curing protein
MIQWLTKTAVTAIHDRQLAEHGGLPGLRDDSLLESALARPQQLDAYGDPPPDLPALAAALAFGLARNHPFVDGNKRTAAVCCETFLRINGQLLRASDAELFPIYLALAEGRLTEADFAAWLRLRLGPAAPVVHEASPRYRARAAASP